DKIFQKIMRSPQYYPTRCEYDILQQHKAALLYHFSGVDSGSFRLIELGAGDGLKTEVLLQYFLSHRADFTYFPVDISSHVLNLLSSCLAAKWPQLSIEPVNKSYGEAVLSMRGDGDKKVILFMGANIGNFTIAEATQFLRKLALPMAA